MALTFGAATSDRVDLAAGNDNQNVFTVLVWVFCTTHTNLRRLMTKGAATSFKDMRLAATTAVDFDVSRLTLNATAQAANSTNETNKWLLWAFTYDETDGPRIFKGALDVLAAEVSYAVRTVGTGASLDDSLGPWHIGNASGATVAFQGRIARAAHFRRRFSLAEIIKWQFVPFTDADCDIYMELGWNGTSTQPNWTTLGAGISGTVTGATVGAHVPLAQPFGFDFSAISRPAVVTHFGASSTTLTFGIASAGQRTRLGASASTFTLGIVSAGQRTRLGASTLPLVLGITSAGVHTGTGASSLGLVFGVSSAGAHEGRGASSLGLVFGIASSGTHEGRGASSLGLVFGVSSAGTRTTFGASSVPLVFGFTSAGAAGKFGASSLPIVFSIFSSGETTGEVFGRSELTLTFGIASQGRAGVFGASSTTFTLGVSSQGTRGANGASSLPLVFGVASSGSRTGIGASSLNLVLGITSSGNAGKFGASSLPIVFTITSSGAEPIQFDPGAAPIILRSRTGRIANRPMTRGYIQTPDTPELVRQ